MKTLVAMTAVLLALNVPVASAFWNDNNDGYANSYGQSDVKGKGYGEGEFSFSFSGKGKGNMDADTDFRGNTHGYNSGNDYYGNDNFDGRFDSNGHGKGSAAGEGSFSMNFTGKGKGSGDFDGNGNMNSDFRNQSHPYYYNPYYYQQK